MNTVSGAGQQVLRINGADHLGHQAMFDPSRIESPHSSYPIFDLDGAVARVGENDTAYGGRDIAHTLNIAVAADRRGIPQRRPAPVTQLADLPVRHTVKNTWRINHV